MVNLKKMKRTILTISLLIIGLLSSFGQPLNKDYIDNWILRTYSNSSIDEKVIYLLNGIPFSSDTLNLALSKFEQTELTTIMYLDHEEVLKLNFCNPITGMILLITKGKQSKKSIANDLVRVRKIYKKPNLKTTSDIDIEKKEPVLIVDGKQVFFRDNYNTLHKLKANEIIGINYIEKPVSVGLYGANGKNGLIIITTKKT